MRWRLKMMEKSVGGILEVAQREGYLADFVGLASRIEKIKPESGRSYMGLVALFATQNMQMWHDVGNQDPVRQSPSHHGRQTLFLDEAHNRLNPEVTILDKLYVFKEYMRRWAARNRDWYSMLDGLANQIIDYEDILLSRCASSS